MNKIKLFREQLNLRQEDIANKLNVGQSTVSMWENGEAKPRVDTLIQLSKIFNCSLDDLVETERNNEK